MAEPTTDDVDALVGPATPQFAFQIRARVRELVAGLPEDDPVRLYGEQQVELLLPGDPAHEQRQRPLGQPQAPPGFRRVRPTARVESVQVHAEGNPLHSFHALALQLACHEIRGSQRGLDQPAQAADVPPGEAARGATH